MIGASQPACDRVAFLPAASTVAAPAGIANPRLNSPRSSMKATVPITIAEMPHTICNSTNTQGVSPDIGIAADTCSLLQLVEWVIIFPSLTVNGNLMSAIIENANAKFIAALRKYLDLHFFYSVDKFVYENNT